MRGNTTAPALSDCAVHRLFVFLWAAVYCNVVHDAHVGW